MQTISGFTCRDCFNHISMQPVNAYMSESLHKWTIMTKFADVRPLPPASPYMKKILTILFSIFLLSSNTVSAQSSGLGDLLRGLGKGSSEKTYDGQKSGLGDILSGVAGALGYGNSAPSIEKLAGTWAYSSPAVSFKSDNFLMKAGGAAAAANVEKKLAPYYKTAGLDRLVLTIDKDSTFTFKARVTLQGTVTHDKEAGIYIFHFQAFKKVNIGAMNAYIQLNGSNAMELTFDVSKLMSIIQKVGAISGNATIQGASTLLNQYDGITAGFELKRASTATNNTTGRK